MNRLWKFPLHKLPSSVSYVLWLCQRFMSVVPACAIFGEDLWISCGSSPFHKWQSSPPHLLVRGQCLRLWKGFVAMASLVLQKRMQR